MLVSYRDSFPAMLFLLNRLFSGKKAIYEYNYNKRAVKANERKENKRMLPQAVRRMVCGEQER